MITKFKLFLESIQFSYDNESEKYRYSKEMNKVMLAKVGDILPNSDIWMFVEYLTKKSENSWKYENSFVEGDLADRLDEWNWYELKEIPINKIDPDEWDSDQDDINVYKEMYLKNNEYPPIVVDKDYSIIDGTHRAKALSLLGLKTIKAFVGTNINSK